MNGYGGDDGDERILIDPSILLDESALEWLAPAGRLVAVSAFFRERLADRPIEAGSPLLPPHRREISEAHREHLLALLDGGDVQIFSLDEADLRTPRQQAIAERLRGSGEMADLIDADQWAYLQSHSVMYSLVRRPLDAFERAGAVINRFGRRVLDEALHRVIREKHFDQYRPHELFARGAIKWLIIGGGGATAGYIGGWPGAIAATGIADIVVRAVDP
jgi:hypothetical protein